MNLEEVFLELSCEDILYIINSNLSKQNIFVSNIQIDKEIYIKNLSYKKFKNINFTFRISKIINNEIVFEISKLKLKNILLPKKILDVILRVIQSNIFKKYDKYKFILNINDILKTSKVYLNIKSIDTSKNFIKITINRFKYKKSLNKVGNKSVGGIGMKLSQTTLKLSGEDIMSFVKDFIKTESVIIGGIDVSQAVYIKGIIVNSFEIGDVSVTIKDLKENLLYIQIKVINSIIPGVTLEHIPIKVQVKDLIKAFDNLNVDLNVSSVRFIDGFLEVKVNNFFMDVKSLSSSSTRVFLT